MHKASPFLEAPGIHGVTERCTERNEIGNERATVTRKATKPGNPAIEQLSAEVTNVRKRTLERINRVRISSVRFRTKWDKENLLAVDGRAKVPELPVNQLPQLLIGSRIEKRERGRKTPLALAIARSRRRWQTWPTIETVS